MALPIQLQTSITHLQPVSFEGPANPCKGLVRTNAEKSACTRAAGVETGPGAAQRVKTAISDQITFPPFMLSYVIWGKESMHKSHGRRKKEPAPAERQQESAGRNWCPVAGIWKCHLVGWKLTSGTYWIYFKKLTGILQWYGVKNTSGITKCLVKSFHRTLKKTARQYVLSCRN